MPGKDLITYDPEDPRNWAPEPETRTKRLLDRIEPFFTESAPWWALKSYLIEVASLYARCCLVILGLIAFLVISSGPFEPAQLFFPGQNPIKKSDFDFLVVLPLEIIKIFFQHLAWTLYPFIPLFLITTYKQVRYGTPAYFFSRKATRERKAAERADKINEYEFRIARQEREAAERKQAEIQAHKAQQVELQQQLRGYLQWRRERVAEAEAEINIEVARARKEAFRLDDERPDAPVLIVRKWMQEIQPKPAKWGYLRESENMTVRRILVNSDSWLPPAPPHPPGITPSMLNPMLLQ